MRPLHEYRVLLFDCDGVILDSNQVKVDAFADALAQYPADVVGRFLEHHRATGGVSRFVKLREFFTSYVVVDDPAVHLERALDAFTQHARHGLLRAPLLPGLQALLERPSGPRYVVSGGAQVELSDVFATRGLERYFAQILGSPTTKEQHLRALQEGGELTAPGVFFGDARKDMEVAEAFGLDFVFVSAVSDWPEGRGVAAERGHAVIEDFRSVAF